MNWKDFIIPVKNIFRHDNTIKYAISEFCNNGISEAPLSKNDKYVGVVSIIDLYEHLMKGKDLNLTLQELNIKEKVVIRIGDSLEDIENRKFDTAIVLDDLKNLIGLVKKADLMKLRLQQLSLNENSSIGNIKANFLISYIGKEIMDIMNDGIYITDNNGVTLYVNKAYTKVSGINKDDLIGMEMPELIKLGYFEESASLKVLETHSHASIIDIYKNGKTCLATSSPVVDNSGNIIAVVTNLRDMTELINLKNKVEETSRLNREYLQQLERIKDENNSFKIVGENKQIKEIHETISYIANVDTTILIQGETGVGKEIFAKEVHDKSSRRNKKFIKVNCAAIPENLFESELFGYEKGAFTGAASTGKEGYFEIADGGTILLDEIAEIPINIQPKLLRVLQEKQIVRVGGTAAIDIDVRIIAATNRELWKQVEKGEFREDLYYRLNIIPITIPPLRERKDDIRLLATHFLEIYNDRYGKQKVITSSALKMLESMEFKGNVRQLKNIIERIVLVCLDDYITEDSICKVLEIKESEVFYYAGEKVKPESLTLSDAIAVLEKSLVMNALNKYKTTRKAASSLGVSQPSIVRKAKKYGITFNEANN